MELTIVNFRSIINSTIKLDKASLVLLKGDSGSNKTSHLDAIQYALYGKVKNVSSNTKKTIVTLKFDDITIVRTRKPNSVTVQYQEKEYFNDEAQAIIDSLFGNNDVFLTSSYLKQKSRHILCLPNPDMNIIRTLALREDISDINNKIEEKIKSEKSSYDKVEASINTLKPIIENIKIKNEGIEIWETKEPEDVKKLKEEISQLSLLKEKVIRQMETLKTLEQFSSVDVDVLTEELKQLQTEVKNINIPKNSIPEELNLKNIQEIETELSSLSIEENVVEEHAKAKENLENIKKNKIILEMINSEDIDKELEEKQTLLKKETKTLASMEKNVSVTTLECPNCNTKLIFDGEKLDKKPTRKGKPGKKYKKEDINSKKEEITAIEVRIASLKDAKSKLVETTEDMFEKWDTLLQQQNKKDNLLKSLEKLKNNKTYKMEDQDRKNEFSAKILDLTSQIKKGKEQNKKIEQAKQMEKIETTVEELNEKIKILQKSIEESNKTKRLNEIKEEYDKYISSYNEKESNLTSLDTRIKGFRTIKAISKQVESDLLYNFIETINMYLEEIVESLFDGNMKAELSFEKDRTDGLKLNKFNVAINYKGMDYASPSQLSGGEEDRLSLALTVAFAKSSNSRIVMLDETLSSVGEDKRQESIDILKEYLDDRITIIVSHDGNIGQYSKIIEFYK